MIISIIMTNVIESLIAYCYVINTILNTLICKIAVTTLSGLELGLMVGLLRVATP